MHPLLTTKEVAEFLNIHEKMVYTLVAEKGMPATKIAGKWLFPRHLIEQWVENNTINFPDPGRPLASNQRLIVLAGGRDLLLDTAISLFNRTYAGHLAVFGHVGGMGGLQALRANLCHIATSQALPEDEPDPAVPDQTRPSAPRPVAITFCRRLHGLLVRKNNPLGILSAADLGRAGLRLANRPLGTTARRLLDRELQRAGIAGDGIAGYHHELADHLDVGLAILAGRADAGPGIEAVAGSLDLDFIPLCWERFDLLMAGDIVAEQSVQAFIGLLQSEPFKEAARTLRGYDLSLTGKIVCHKG